MLTAKDIKKLSDYLLVVFKDVFATKEELGDAFSILNNKLDGLQMTVDLIAKNNKEINEKLTVHEYRITKLENAK